jgi:hypothetical protein
MLWFVEPSIINGQTVPITVETNVKSEAEKKWKAVGGQTIELSLAIYGTPKDKIEIQADLFQIGSGKIAAPVKKDIPVVSDIDLTQNSQRRIVYLLELPDVEQASDFMIRYRSRISGEDKWQIAGSANIRAYPTDILKPVQLFAKNNLICLYGETKKLSAILKDKNISFEDRKDNFPKECKDRCLILAEFTDKDWFKLPKDLPSNQAAIVFYPNSKGLPRAVIKQAGNGTLLQVKMDLLDKLINDPEAQESFVEIFNSALEYFENTK